MIRSPARRRLILLGAGVIGAGLAALACSPLRTFDALVPQDRDGRLIARGISYGPGPRRMLDLYGPRIGTGQRPIILFLYGGSWATGTREGYAFVGRSLAAAGYLVAVPDYRLVPEVTYPGFVEDGAAALRWLRAHAAAHGGDPDRIVVMGHSAGAYIAAMLAADPRWTGADRAAIRGLIGLAGPYDFAPFDVPASIAAFGRWPDPADTQPVTHAGAGDPPALLLTGADDITVEPRNSEALAARLRAGGVAADVKRYPGIGHVGIVTAIARPFRQRAPVLADALAFAAAVTAAH